MTPSGQFNLIKSLLPFPIGSALGDCVDDTFSVTSSAGRGSPVICGYNTDQHSK